MDSFKHICAALERAEVTEFNEELSVDEDTMLVADHDADEGRLYLSADVATSPEGRCTATYERLLPYNRTRIPRSPASIASTS